MRLFSRSNFSLRLQYSVLNLNNPSETAQKLSFSTLYWNQFPSQIRQFLTKSGHPYCQYSPEVWFFVVSWHLLSRQDFNEGNQFQPIAEVFGEIFNDLINGLQMLIGPSGECILLNAFPFGVSLRTRYNIIFIIIMTNSFFRNN